MKTQDIQFLFEYNYWARDSILENVAKLSPQQFIEPRTSDHGSIRNTLVHILSSEWIWRMRCQEHISPTELLAFDDFPSPETLRARWQQEERKLRIYLYELHAQELERIVQYKRTGGESQENILWHLLVHTVNHGTEHRSMVAAALTEYGYSPGDLDIVHFLRARADHRARRLPQRRQAL